jgi:hypothetical protein
MVMRVRLVLGKKIEEMKATLAMRSLLTNL